MKDGSKTRTMGEKEGGKPSDKMEEQLIDDRKKKEH